MSNTDNSVGQVLGASAAIGGGVAILPATGSNTIQMILPAITIAAGAIVIFSMIIIRAYRFVNNRKFSK